MQMFVNYSSTS